MHLSTLLLLALSAGALAKDGDIGSYNDATCTEVNGKKLDAGDGVCVVFTPSTNNIGINWGSGISGPSYIGMQAYTDTKCATPGPSPYPKPTYNDPAKSAGSCISYAVEKTIGGAWGSIKLYTSEYELTGQYKRAVNVTKTFVA